MPKDACSLRQNKISFSPCQDDEVMSAEVSACHFPMTECFKDASTLANSVTSAETNEKNDNTLSDDSMSSSAAQFRGHVESESREPLLLSSPDC